MDADTGAPHLITVPPAPAPVIVAPPAVKEATRFLTDLYYIDDLNTSFENALKTNPITERNDKITSILATKKYGCKYDDLEAGLARFRQTSFVPWTGTYTVYDTRDSKGGALILTVRGSKTGILFLCINGTPVYEVVDTSDSTTRSLRYTDSLSSKVGQITFKMHDSVSYESALSGVLVSDLALSSGIDLEWRSKADMLVSHCTIRMESGQRTPLTKVLRRHSTLLPISMQSFFFVGVPSI